MDPHSGSFGEPGPGKYVRLLQNAIDDLRADDEASRNALYSRARALLESRLAARKNLSQAQIDTEKCDFDEAVWRVEGQVRLSATAPVRIESVPGDLHIIPAHDGDTSQRLVSPDIRTESPSGRPRAARKPGASRPGSWLAAKAQFAARWSVLLRAPKDIVRGGRELLIELGIRVRLFVKRICAEFAAKGKAKVRSEPLVVSSRTKSTDLGPPQGHSVNRLEAQRSPQYQARLQAIIQVARHHGVELDVGELKTDESDIYPSAAALSTWAQNAGLWSRAVRTTWRHLLGMGEADPVVLLLADGGAAVMVNANADQNIVMLRDPGASADGAVPVDELRLSQVWNGEAILLRASRSRVAADAPFDLRWLFDLVLHERRLLRDIGIASLTISFLTIFPPLLVMTMVNKVLQFHSTSTLLMLAAVMAVVVLYESLLGHARRHIIAVVGARLDAKLNLHVFNRLLRLPLDYFERHPAGETMYRIAQVYRVREFLTGRLLTTFLDLMTLCVLLPFLFYLSPILASIVLGCAGAILLIIIAFLKPMREMYGRVTTAETWKSATLGETIVGIKTVKALALEPQRRALWDERIAEAGKWRLEFGRLSNWPQTLVTPIERLMVLGTTMLGAYLAINDPSGYMVGGLFAFLMLSARAAQPLVGLARLIEDYEEVGAAIGEASSVLNRPTESSARAAGLRPKFEGAIAFQDVSFTYLNTTVPALDRISFSVPAGSTLGIVGRSGSGKSTVTRLLQGINRDYKGFVKIDGADLRDVDLRHLRQSLGVVLQENFLFRGSIRDNIIAGRPGLTLSDAVYAARLAGAEEFIERMPNGFETYIEEGSPNLSGGQRQRLAIARALITDPRILILDEATSALDPESEAVVTANLERIASGRTMIIVSHRLSSLVGCDQILVLDQGTIVDCGAHNALVERCAIYRQLWNQQNRHSETTRPSVSPKLISGGANEP
ncbi:peptidase domain-containing ABC transporter [Bradyrhizobium sp. USDA 3364]